MRPHAMRQGPLQDADVMAFAVMSRKPAYRSFYQRTLGLRVVDDDEMALVLDSGGSIIRIQKSASHQPAPYTILGWRVPDIGSSVARLTAAGVKFERYDWMTFQDERGIATFPNGDQVAWFKDPEGNILSVAQLK